MQKKRSEIEAKYKWKLEDLYATNDKWEKEFLALKKNIGEFAKYQGKLHDKQSALKLLELKFNSMHIASKLYCYANMRRDEDFSENKYLAMVEKITGLHSMLGSAQSFIVPELNEIDEKLLRAYISDKEFADYDFFLKDVLKDKPHILSEKEEKILADVSSFSGQFDDVYDILCNMELNFAPVTLDDGKEVSSGHSDYSHIMATNKNQNDRKKVFDAHFAAYKSVLNTISANYAGSVKKDWFFAKAHKFDSCLTNELFDDAIEEKVYTNLIEQVQTATPLLHKYMTLRKKNLNLKSLNMYDLHFPLFGEANFGCDFDAAYDLVVKALAPMGKDYQEKLNNAKTENWIDVLPSENKKSGAYKWGAYGTHPFVLLNHTNSTNCVFTIAHEMGHAMHSYYSNKNQPMTKAGYTIFLAEIASTVNEVLLLKYLSKNTDNKEEKKYLLSVLLDMFRTTIFRQTKFAQFEYIVHKKAENNEPLTADTFCEIYLDLCKKYYGKALNYNEQIAYEWARIPHFYNSFYVYKYATGLICAIYFATKIESGDKDVLNKYFTLLSSGGNDYPTNILKKAGIDLTQNTVYEQAFAVFKQTLDELEKLI